jgi:hypothetical protein
MCALIKTGHSKLGVTFKGFLFRYGKDGRSYTLITENASQQQALQVSKQTEETYRKG